MEIFKCYEQRVAGQMQPAGISGDPPHAACAPPPRLRSHKRRALVERQVCGSPNDNSATLPTQKRLRRTQAYSDLECSNRPRNSPIIPISVHHDAWLDHAVIKARKIIHDKENAENFLQHVAAAPSVESLITPGSSKLLGVHDVPPRLSLNHKNKTENLHSKYNSPASSSSEDERASFEPLHRKGKTEDLRSKYSSPTGEEVAAPELLPSLEESRLGSSSSNDTDGPIESSASPQSPGDKQQGYLYCICQQTFDSALGEMVACDICDGWFHLRCVGQDQHDATYFENKSFYCLRCEAFAYREIVSEEDTSVNL